MWDPGTALLATAVVAGGALAVPPVARGAGGFCAVIGLLGVVQGRTGVFPLKWPLQLSGEFVYVSES